MVPTTKILKVPRPTFEFKVVDQVNKCLNKCSFERSNKRLIEQSNEVIDDPVLQFRQCLFQRLKFPRSARSGRGGIVERNCNTIDVVEKTWNEYVDGEKLAILRFSGGVA